MIFVFYTYMFDIWFMQIRLKNNELFVILYTVLSPLVQSLTFKLILWIHFIFMSTIKIFSTFRELDLLSLVK